jgi:hypothetical protein
MSETDKIQEKSIPEGMSAVEEVNISVPFAENFVYSNVTALSTSMMDVRISFAEAMPDRTVHPRVGIVMPPEHAAQLVINLLQQLYFFEKNFGEIRNPAWHSFQERAKANMLRAQTEQTEKPSEQS